MAGNGRYQIQNLIDQFGRTYLFDPCFYYWLALMYLV